MSVVLLPQNAASLSKLASQDDARYAITGVRVAKRAKTYIVEATDGKVMGRLEGPLEDETKYPPLEELAKSNGHTEAVLPRTDFIAAAKGIPKARKVGCRPILQNLAVNIGAETSILATTDLDTKQCREVRHVEGRWPPVDAVIPTKEPIFAIRLDPKRLITLLQVAAEFCGDAEEEGAVTLELHGHNVAAAIKAETNGQKFIGLIMPMTVQDRAEETRLATKDQYLRRASASAKKANEKQSEANI